MTAHDFVEEALTDGGAKTVEGEPGNNAGKPNDEKKEQQKEKESEQREKEKQVNVLLAVAKAARDDQKQERASPDQDGTPLFHSPAPDCEAYADIVVDGHRETHPVHGRNFKQFLRHQYYKRTGEGCNAEALKTAIETIAAVAEFEGDERPVFCRIAGNDGAIYIDVGDATWRAIEVTARGWNVIDRPPVRFVRSASTKALPLPQPGGKIAELRPFCNVKSDDEFILVVAYILAAMRPDANYPILTVTGEQGSSKSTLGRIVQQLVDPRIPAHRTLPRDEADLIVAAKGAHLLNFDNISGMADWLSDAFCRISTGGGAGKRKLYTDDDEILFSGRRPVFLNGIEDVVVRPDLVDRAIMLTMERILDVNRRDEKEFDAEFERAAPKIFGALLDGLSAGLKNLAGIRMSDKPRMADFALWGEACARAHWQPETFLTAYRNNLDAAVELVLESSPVGDAVRRFMSGRDKWSGTASDLLPLLTAIVGEQASKERSWPRRPDALSGKLRRAAPPLRKIGIDVTFVREGHAGTRTIDINNRRKTE